ncbi:MAG TPA: RNA polymerase sigma factor RpoD/SigA [Flavisolibacter sp.]|jgi:RNA polymerase primary sigma factor|nr:RNA polymerase sigma factor RpoD/SigA [Flavisolibacter sp.]
MRQLTITQSITNRGSLSLDRYLQEIGKEEMISIQREIELAQAIRRGDKEALEELTKANLRFVVSVAKQYQFRGLSLSDLINEGNLGLINAATRFDETKGFKFISYAVWWIRQSIMQAINDQGRMVRLPSNRVSLGNKMQRAVSLWEQMHERTPSEEELAEEMKISQQDLLSIANYQINYVSLNSPNPITGEETMLDTMIDDEADGTDEQVEYIQSLTIEIKRCLKTLPDRDRNIVCAFFGIGLPEPLSLNQIAIQYNMSGERIRQIKDKAIFHLRNPKKSHLLKQYL